MTDSETTTDLKKLWRDQPAEMPPMTLELIHARGFQSHIRRRNLIEYVACAVVVCVFSTYVIVLPDPILKIASALIAFGTLIVPYQLHRRASARTAPATDSLAFHRAELVRQREAIGSAWLWYFAPFAPGTLLFVGRTTFGFPEIPLIYRLVTPALTLVYGVVWVWINGRALRSLQAEIDDLDALRE